MEHRDQLDDTHDEDRSIDKPRKREAPVQRDRGSPTRHPEQHEEFAGTERLPSADETEEEERSG